MASKSSHESKAEQIKEAIRQLNQALDSCHKLLQDVEQDVAKSRQDNLPRMK